MNGDFSSPRDTSRAMHDPAEALLMMAESLGPGGIARAITNQEAAGQRELVNSDVIPTKGCDEDELTALGFKLGPVVEGDPLFRRTTLPAGWTREGSEHAMGSYLLDELGRKRVSIFYKAAFYDRSAHMSVTSVRGYVDACAYEGKQVVFDAAWATKGMVLAAIDELRAYDAQQVTFWTEHGNEEYVREYSQKTAAWDAFKAQINGGAQ